MAIRRYSIQREYRSVCISMDGLQVMIDSTHLEACLLVLGSSMLELVFKQPVFLSVGWIRCTISTRSYTLRFEQVLGDSVCKDNNEND